LGICISEGGKNKRGGDADVVEKVRSVIRRFLGGGRLDRNIRRGRSMLLRGRKIGEKEI